MLNRVVLALCLSLLAPACGADAGLQSEDSSLGEREQAFTSNWNFSWGVTSSSSIDIGSSVGRTCFLTGMVGNFRSSSAGSNLGVEVALHPNNYTLGVTTDGVSLGAYARCVGSAAGRTAEGFWQTGDSPRVLGPATGNRRCFLTGLFTFRDIPTQQGFRSDSDNVRVEVKNGNWQLTGTQSGLVIAHAGCMNVSSDVGSWTWTAGHDAFAWVWDWPVKKRVFIDSARHDPMADDRDGTNCFLTSISGDFQTNDWADGVFISQSGGKFIMNTKNGKSGSATCVR